MNIRLVNLLRRKLETDRVDAVPLSCWFWAVVEYMAKVGVALFKTFEINCNWFHLSILYIAIETHVRTNYLDPNHSITDILPLCNTPFLRGAME